MIGFSVSRISRTVPSRKSRSNFLRPALCSGGELVDEGLGLPGLAGQCLLPRVDPVQQDPARARRGHASRHDGADVPVSRRAITSVIAQYTRDAELDSRCS